MKKLNLFLMLTALAACLTAVGCSDDDTVIDPGDDNAVVVSDTLRGSTGDKNVVVEPSSNSTIYLSGYYFIKPGTTLTIPKGTKVIGLPESVAGTPSAIIAERGTATAASGQLIAEGTASEPIVFTSNQPVGSRGRSNWGGIVLAGLSTLNVPGGSGLIEGVGGTYGYGGVLSAPNIADNSGKLRYVRIEFGGTKVTPDNEINGLTMAAVGSATEINYVQTHMIADDGFEWFGGTVNGKYLVSSGNDDDAFDMDYGYSGNVQYLLALQDPDLANRGFEVDNNGDDNEALPRTSAKIANATLIGTGQIQTAAGERNDGFYVRRGAALQIFNSIVVNFQHAYLIDGASTRDQLGNDAFIKNSILVGLDQTYGTKNASEFTDLASAWNNLTQDPQLTSISFTNPNPVPNLAAAANVGQVPSTNGFFDPVTFAGAFNPASGSLWISGWTNFARN